MQGFAGASPHDIPPEPLEALGPIERLVGAPVGEHYVYVRETVGRGTTVELDGERYLHEGVTKEFARFVLWAGGVVLVGAFLVGLLLGHSL